MTGKIFILMVIIIAVLFIAYALLQNYRIGVQDRSIGSESQAIRMKLNQIPVVLSKAGNEIISCEIVIGSNGNVEVKRLDDSNNISVKLENGLINLGIRNENVVLSVLGLDGKARIRTGPSIIKMIEWIRIERTSFTDVENAGILSFEKKKGLLNDLSLKKLLSQGDCYISPDNLDRLVYVGFDGPTRFLNMHITSPDGKTTTMINFRFVGEVSLSVIKDVAFFILTQVKYSW